MRHGSIALLTLFVLAHSAAAGAQPGTRPLWTASGTAGLGQTWDDESSLGRGLFLAGRVERRLIRGLSFECGADWLSHHRGGGEFQADGHMTFVGAALKYLMERSDCLQLRRWRTRRGTVQRVDILR